MEDDDGEKLVIRPTTATGLPSCSQAGRVCRPAIASGCGWDEGLARRARRRRQRAARVRSAALAAIVSPHAAAPAALSKARASRPAPYRAFGDLVHYLS